MIAQVDLVALGGFAVLIIGTLTTSTVAIIRALHENTKATTAAGNDAQAAALSSKATADATDTGNGRSMAEVVQESNALLHALAVSVEAHHANKSIHGGA